MTTRSLRLSGPTSPRAGPSAPASTTGTSSFATKDPASGESRGVAIDLTRELGRRLGVPVDDRRLRQRRRHGGRREDRRLGHRVPRDRSGARGRDRLHRRLPRDRGHLSRAGGVAAPRRGGRRPGGGARRRAGPGQLRAYLGRHLRRAELVRAAANAEAAFKISRPARWRCSPDSGRRCIALPERLPGVARARRPVHGGAAGRRHAAGARRGARVPPWGRRGREGLRDGRARDRADGRAGRHGGARERPGGRDDPRSSSTARPGRKTGRRR